MGSVLYDFLTESVLFDSEHLKDQYLGLSDDELNSVLQSYREFCLSHREELVAEVVAGESDFRVFPGTHSVLPDLLKQSALYVGSYVLCDPLFPLTEHEKGFDRAVRSYFGQKETKGVDRVALAEAVTQLKNLTPMIAANYVKFLPVSHLFEAPDAPPLYYSKTRFSDALPPDLLSFFHQKKSVRTLRRDKTAWVEDPGASLSRCIAIDFGDDYPAGMIYQLFEHEVENFDEVARTYTARLTFPDRPPTQEYYDAWVEQSVNRTAINLYDRLSTELVLALRLGASYLSFSEFRNELLVKFFPVKVGRAEHSASVILRLNLPFLDEIDTETLMKVRRDESEAFQMFRHELDRQFGELRTEEDPEILRIKADKMVYEMETVQQKQLERRLQQLRRGTLAKTVVVSATLGASFMPGGHYLPAIIAAAASAYEVQANYSAELRQNPAFFLWKARRIAKRARS